MGPSAINMLPIVGSPMDSICSPSLIEKTESKVFQLFSCRFWSIDVQIQHIQQGKGSVGGVFGINTPMSDIERLVDAGASHIMLDVAHGANKIVREKLIELQHLRGSGVFLWAGNIATDLGYHYIAQLCDYVRVGIGSGSACSTRLNTGIGVGSITSLLNIRQAYELRSIRFDCYNPWPPAKIVADGGIKFNGDICKALVAGAHLVMLGKMLAATTESAAHPCTYNGLLLPLESPLTTHKRYRGMASKEVNEEAGRQIYSNEGGSGIIKCTGPVTTLLEQIDANLRSCMSYMGAASLDKMYRPELLRVISSGVSIENKTHLE